MASSSSSSAPKKDILLEPKKEIVHIEHCKDINGFDKVILREGRGWCVEVYLYGAHVTSWKNERGEEMLFVSSKSKYAPRKAIRGGIPICFPQYSNLGPFEVNGFARSKVWSIDQAPPPLPTTSSHKAFIDLILKDSNEEIKKWSHRYEFRLRVTLGPGGELTMISRIRNLNTDRKPFSFTFAYYNYFKLTDISEVRIEGLETLYYLDNLNNRERTTEQADAVTFESEVDRMYLTTPSKIAVLDHERKRTYVIRKDDGLPDAVVWNPWDKKSKSMRDFGDEEYKTMVCVAPACVEQTITLRPGEEWTGRQELTVAPSSYCSGQLDPGKALLCSSLAKLIK